MKTADKIRKIYLISILGIYPLFPGLHGYEDISREKIVFFVLCSLALFIALAVSRDRKDFLSRAGLSEIAAFIFAAAAALSFLFSRIEREKLLLGQNYDGLILILLFVLVFFALSGGIYKREDIVMILFVSSLLAALVCVLQLMGLNPLRLYPEGARLSGRGKDYSGVYLGTFGNQNLLSAYFSLLAPFFIWEIIFSKNPRRFWLFVPAALFVFISVRLRQSAFLISFSVCLLLALLIRVAGGRRAGYIIAGFLLALLAFFGIVYFINPENETLFELHEILHGRTSAQFGSKRLMIWAETLEIFKKRPIAGHGPASLPYLFTLSFKRFVPETGTVLISYLNSAHNEFLSHLAQLGVLGLSAHIFFIAAVLKGVKYGPDTGLALAAAGYLFYSFFGNLGGAVTPLFYIFMALAAASSKEENKLEP